MKSRIRVSAGLAVMFSMMAFVMDPSPIAQQKPAVDEQALKKEVNAFMDQYWTLWSAGQIDQLVAQIYHPSGQLNNTGHSSIEQMKANFPQTRKTLLDGGYGRSQMPVRNVCILAPTVAVVSGRGFRYLADGKVMGEYGWTYTLLKGSAGWKMVSIYSHDPGRALTCPG